jgi:hypothetical protein
MLRIRRGTMRAPADYAFKTTPFIYSVGESDDRGTLKGIAKLVYGDQKRWIQIYEANRDKVTNPNALSYGMALTIPGSREPEPKLETKVLPTYPPEATRQHIRGGSDGCHAQRRRYGSNIESHRG